MLNLLHTIGLMTRAEHEAASFRVQCQAAEALTEIENLKAELRAADNLASGWEAKYKKAVADLEKQAGEIADYRQALARAENMMDQASERLAEIREERDDLRPDALAMRRKRQMDRDRRKGR